MKYQLGDKVKVTRIFPHSGDEDEGMKDLVGLIGTIKTVDEYSTYPYMVNFSDLNKEIDFREIELKKINDNQTNPNSGIIIGE